MIYNQLVLGAITHPIDNCWARAIAVDTLAISGVYSMFKHHQTDQWPPRWELQHRHAEDFERSLVMFWRQAATSETPDVPG